MTRSCHAGDGNGNLRAADRTNAARHFFGGFRADRAVFPQRVGRYAEEFLLAVIGIRHDAAVKHRGSAGNIRQPLGDQSRGAGLCRCDVQTFFSERLHDDLLDAVHVDAVYVCAEPAPNFLEYGLHQLLRLRLGCGGRRDAQERLARFGVRRDGRVAPLKQIRHAACHIAFADPHRVRTDHTAGFWHQIGHDLFAEHRLRFPRRSRQKNNALAVLFHRDARRGTVRVLEHDPAARHIRLFEIALGHLSPAAFEKVAHAPFGFPVSLGGKAEQVHAHLFGEIVRRGTEPAGKQHNIAAGQRALHRFAQTRGIVSHRCAALHGNPHRRKLRRQKRRVGIDDLSEQQLRADGKNFTRKHRLPLHRAHKSS